MTTGLGWGGREEFNGMSEERNEVDRRSGSVTWRVRGPFVFTGEVNGRRRADWWEVNARGVAARGMSRLQWPFPFPHGLRTGWRGRWWENKEAGVVIGRMRERSQLTTLSAV